MLEHVKWKYMDWLLSGVITKIIKMKLDCEIIINDSRNPDDSKVAKFLVF